VSGREPAPVGRSTTSIHPGVVRWVLVLVLTGCFDAGTPPPCTPDLALVGFPGVDDHHHSYAVTGGEVVDLCVRLDSSRNTADVTFDAKLPFDPFPIELRGVDNTRLAAGEGSLELVVPAGEVWFARLSFEVPRRIASTTARLELAFSQAFQ
jgi:hypothetical protein